ncbi:MAG: YfiR family protein [Planctomycetaceae bacterium]|nr:YfiR family protein [Planctomycetales bacterium]MCB9921213.1 YfiR family protein [Planctomycetaceae bacterium]
MKTGQRLLGLTVVIALLSTLEKEASAQINREAELKGKMVGILGSLVTWPPNAAPSAAKPLTIGVLGNNPFVDGGGVDYLQQKLAGTNSLVLKFADVNAYKDCHILVVAGNADLKQALEKTAGKPVLVVSEAAGLAKQGAAINLVFDMVSNKIRLEINPATARNAGVQINQGLLRSPLVDIVN